MNTTMNPVTLARELQIQPYDLLLMGDGSGNTVDSSCGWFVTLYDRLREKIVHLFGGTNSGTNNYAELMPYLHALWVYHAKNHGEEKLLRPVRVAIVSDSEVTVRCGNGLYARKSNLALWAAIDWFEKAGYDFTWYHIPRNTTSFHKQADRVAGTIRKAMEHMNDERRNADGQETS